MVHFIALLKATQNSDGIFFIGLIDKYLLEATLQGGILFHILTVLVQRGCTHAMQFPSSQCWLEHIAGIHGPFRLAGTDHGVQLVDKQDDTPLLLGELIQHRLQTLFKVTPKLGACQKSSQVQRQDTLILQTLRHFAIDNTLREALNNGRLANAGLTNQHGIVFGTAL